MAQKLTESFITTVTPGSYIDVNVKSNPVGAGNSGNIVIVGEAEGGEATFGIDSANGLILKDNYYAPSQASEVINKYISGNIVDAFRALASPSSDADIVGAPNRIYIAKTNKGTQAVATIASSYGILKDKNYGAGGNRYNYQVTQTKSEVAPSITGDALTFSATTEEGSIVIAQSAMADGDYFYITAQDGTKYAVALDTTGGAANEPTGAKYVGADYKVYLDVSGAATDPALATAIIGAFNGLTDFTSKVTLSDTTSAIIGIAQVTAGVVATLPEAYNKDDTSSGASVGACGTAYVSTQTGDDADGSLFNGLEFTVRDQGAVETVITLSNTESDHDSISDLASEIDAALPTALSCSAVGNQLKIFMADISDDTSNVLGYGRCFELIDSTPGDLAAIGFDEGLNYSSQEPEIQLNINRSDTNVTEEFIIPAEVAMTIGYNGTTATLSITDSALTTTVTGGSGSNLSIDLAEFSTLKDLADYINSQTGYNCTVDPTSTSRLPSVLDDVTDLPIAVTGTNIEAGRIKKSLYNFNSKANDSAVLNFTASESKGLPLKMSTIAYLSGGTKGATTAADIVNAISDLETIDINFVIPLFSRNASDDIGDSLTDSNSTYTIDAINALVKSHILKMSTPKIKKHRTAFLSYWGTYTEVKQKVGSISHYRASMCFQRATQVNSVGDQVSYLPWYSSCIAAGMQAAGFYKAIVNKYANIISFTDPEGYDSGNPGQVEDAITSGLLFFEKTTSGNVWVSDQTTYSYDENFVYNSIQAVYTSDIVALDLTSSFKRAIVGKSLADVDDTAALSFLAQKMDQYKKQKLIAASSDAPLGFKNAKIQIIAPVMRVGVEIKLSTAVYFVPINLDISQITSA